jgi:hypothetical protein
VSLPEPAPPSVPATRCEGRRRSPLTTAQAQAHTRGCARGQMLDGGKFKGDGMSRYLLKGLAGHLAGCSIPAELAASQNEADYQRWVTGRIREWLKGRHGGDFALKAEALGGGVRAVPMFGTTFWPDIAVGLADRPALLAVVVQCLTKKGLPSPVSSAIGQAVIYREQYELCLVVMVLLDDLAIALPESLAGKLSKNDIELVRIGPV